MPFGIFEPASTPPVLVEAYTGYPRSVDVLGLTKQGEQIVVVYCQTDDEPDLYGWRTTCRNAWDVTDEIVGWMSLPAPIVRGGEMDDSTRVEQSKQLQQLIASLTEARDKIILPLMRDLRSHAPEQLEELLHGLSAGFLFSETRSTLSRCSSPYSSLMHLPDWLRQECRDEIRKHGWPNEGRVAFIKNQAKEFGYRYDFATNGFVYIGPEPEPVTDPRQSSSETGSTR
jgi:hypothetical protein